VEYEQSVLEYEQSVLEYENVLEQTMQDKHNLEIENQKLINLLEEEIKQREEIKYLNEEIKYLKAEKTELTNLLDTNFFQIGIQNNEKINYLEQENKDLNAENKKLLYENTLLKNLFIALNEDEKTKEILESKIEKIADESTNS
jgi:hypothetical protein